MVIAERVRKAVVCAALRLIRYIKSIRICVWSYREWLTNDALPEKVRLALGCFVSGELPINLILYIRHRDERSHDTTPPPSLD